jgi:hypothetical protein
VGEDFNPSRRRAKEEFRASIRAAADEGIPLSRIAGAAEISCERARQLRAGR